MVYVHLRALLDPAYVSFCHVGDTLDCETATTSRFSSLLGVPLAVWGFAGYVVMFVLAGTRAFLPLAGFATLVALFLAGVSAFSLGVLCPLCAATWVLDGALLVVGILRRRQAIAPSRNRLLIAGALGAAIVAAGFFAVPPMAPLSAWRSGMQLPHGVDEEGHPWIGAAQPTVVIEEFIDYACTHCRFAHSHLRALVAKKPDSVRLVRHDYARMPCKVPHNPERSRICVHARFAYCARQAGRFWEMSDWLFSRPKPAAKPNLGEAARSAGVDEAELQACLARPDTYRAMHREYEHARSVGVRGTPGFVVNGKKASIAEVIEAIRAAP